MGCVNDGEEFGKANMGWVGRKVIGVKMGRDWVDRDMWQ
jgi:hypothetical protein